MRLQDKVGIVVGAGQTLGDTIGNGRAAAVLFAREGAKVLLVDRDPSSVAETKAMIDAGGGVSQVFEGDWTRAEDCRAYVGVCVEAWGRIDFLHNNVGIGAGDGPPHRVTEEAFDRIIGVNLRGCMLSCQAAVPVMRAQRSGSIVNISSIAAIAATPLTAYKVSKAGMNAYSQSLALANANYGVRVNAIMPGLMDTPMAIEGTARELGASTADVRTARDRMVPLGAKMGTAWDVAYASLFLHSDEAAFITGVVLPVDGGQSAKVG